MFGRSTGSFRPSRNSEPWEGSEPPAMGSDGKAVYARGDHRIARLAVAVLLVAGAVSEAHAADGEAQVFGLVDLSLQRAPEGLRSELERWAAGRGMTAVADLGMRRALAGPEPARVSIGRLAAAARAKQEAGDCAGAVAAATEAEGVALGSLGVDDEREPLKSLYVTLLVCHD